MVEGPTAPVLLAGVVAAVLRAGSFAAAEFSSVLGLVIAVVCMAAAPGPARTCCRFAPVVTAAAAVVMWPVIEHRLEGFQTRARAGRCSWTTRLDEPANLLLARAVLRRQPAARRPPVGPRAVADHQGTGFVWIESGYTWLLWGGGVPLLAAFLAFVVVTCGPRA